MRLGDSNFINLFQQLVASTNSDRNRDEWRVAGVAWSRQRIAQWTAGLSFQIETHRLHHAHAGTWTLFVVHELWWGENRSKTIRNVHWARLEHGSAKDVLKWIKLQAEALRL